MQLLFNKLRGARPQAEDPHSQPNLSLTEHLLSSAPAEYRSATQSPFLRLAGEGRLSKEVLGKWLAGQRLYLHSYIRAAGNLLASVDLPLTGWGTEEEPEVMRLVDWIIEYLVETRETERRIVDVAARYGISLEAGESGGEAGVGPVEPPRLPGAVDAGRSVGLLLGTCSERSTASRPSAAPPVLLPWLEAAVMFWATERVFVDAWSWAREHQSAGGDEGARADQDGGAMRSEFIPSWSSDGAREFVDRLQGIIDDAVAGEIERRGNGVREEVLRRTEGKWKSLVAGSGEIWLGIEEP